MAVQHNKWSQFEHEGHHYRLRLIDYGWSYARFQIQKQTNTRRKYFIFDELIPTWEHLVSPNFDYLPGDSFLRKNFYDAGWVKIMAIKAIKTETNSNNYKLYHENKI